MNKGEQIEEDHKMIEQRCFNWAAKACLALLASIITAAVGVTVVWADDVHVKGYYRSDGTYVRPHIRSAPDSVKWNNYGPSRNSSQLLNPRRRDYDRDGIPNYLDLDSDNDGRFDDIDQNPYGRRR